MIYISPTAIRSEHGTKQRELSWSEISHVDFSEREGVHWTLKPASGEAMVLWLDEFDDGQRARIGELIQENVRSHGSRSNRS